MNAELLQEVLRQTRATADEGRVQLQAELQNALQQLQGQVQQTRQQQIVAVNGADPADELRARLDDLERQLRPDPQAAPLPADGAVPGVLFAGRPAAPPRDGGLLAGGPGGGHGLFAGQIGSVKLQPPPNFTGSNSMDEWDSFSFKLKM